MKNIKIIFLDIDGTLTNSLKKVDINTQKIISQLEKMGILIVLCSGRIESYLEDIKKTYGFSRFHISSNGASVFDSLTKKYLFENTISYDNAEKLWNFLNELHLSCIINTKDIRYVNSYYQSPLMEQMVFLDSFACLKEESLFQFVISSDDYEKMNQLERYINESKVFKITNISNTYLEKNLSMKYSFDINNITVNKGNAIIELLNFLNLKQEDSMCFGDHWNDLEMFDVCSIKVAMGNAKKELKKKADFITKTNDEEGIYYFLKYFVN